MERCPPSKSRALELAPLAVRIQWRTSIELDLRSRPFACELTIERSSTLEHCTRDIEQPINDRAQGAGMAVTFGPEGVVLGPTRGIVLDRVLPSDRSRMSSADCRHTDASPCSSCRFVVSPELTHTELAKHDSLCAAECLKPLRAVWRGRSWRRLAANRGSPRRAARFSSPVRFHHPCRQLAPRDFCRADQVAARLP